MIHEGKLNGALNRSFFPRFHSSRLCVPPLPHPERSPGIDCLSSPSVCLPVHFFTLLSHAFDFLFPNLSTCLSISIYLFYMPIRFIRLSFILFFPSILSLSPNGQPVLHSEDSSKFFHLFCKCTTNGILVK